MSFDDALAGLAGAVSDNLGQTATFTPAGGDPATCKVIVSAPDIMAGLGDARTVASDARIEVQVSALATAPRKNDVFVVGARTYVCVDRARKREDDAQFYTVDVEAR